jgi:hypothetical protein
MQDPKVHTINIFEQLYNFVKAIIPKEIDDDMHHALDQLRGDFDISLEGIEDTMINFGKKVWPYRKSYTEMLSSYEGKLGEQFLLSRLPKEFKKSYNKFKDNGGSFRDLHSGAAAEFFSSVERQGLCEVLVSVHQDLRSHVVQAVHSTEEKLFENKVKEFTNILNNIEKKLDVMREMADQEQEHPKLAEEIRDHVRTFELGLAAIGPESSYQELCDNHDHFVGRKQDLKKTRVW